jgi:RAB protein geranylgeranyltransferase component A
MSSIRELLEKKLRRTFAFDLLGESGSPEEGREEIYEEVENVFVNILDEIKEMSDLEQCQCAEDMQYALEKIYDHVNKIIVEIKQK